VVIIHGLYVIVPLPEQRDFPLSRRIDRSDIVL
jgi:hypothetical protein